VFKKSNSKTNNFKDNIVSNSERIKMGFLNGKSKKEEQDEARKVFQEAFGLENLEGRDLEILDMTIKETVTLTGDGLGELTNIGTINWTGVERNMVNASRTIMRQNWLLLRQLSKINQKLEKLLKK
jgi:hypothetical protein